jgi:hypothetical protein
VAPGMMGGSGFALVAVLVQSTFVWKRTGEGKVGDYGIYASINLGAC